jgi:hypothetical protein
MNDARSLLSDLRRPRMLIRAARLGLADYRRERDLRRLISTGTPDRPDQVVPRLLDEEARLEGDRCDGEVSYSLTRHVEVLIALMAEVQLLPARA